MSPRLRQFLRHCWYRGWALVAAVLILVALAFSALRLLLPAVPGYKSELEKIAGGYLNAPVAITRIETEWKWFRPRLRLLDVEIRKTGATPEAPAARFQVDEIILGLNPLASALQWRVMVDEITVAGTHLSVRRDAAGRVFVNGIPLNGGNNAAPKPAVFPPALLNRTIRLVDSRIDYQDEILDFDYRLDAVNLSGHTDGDVNNVYASVNLPPDLGESLELGLQFSGDWRDPDTLKGRAFVRGTGIELPAWAARFNQSERVLAGRMNIDAWLDFGNRRPNDWRMQGRLELQNPRLNLAALNRKAAVEEWSLRSLSTDFRLARNGALARLDLQNLQLTNTDEVSWPAGGLSLEGRLAEGANFRQGRLAMDFVRVRELLPLLRLSPAFNDGVQRLGVDGLDGDFYDLYLDWDLLSGQPSWDLRTGFSAVSVRGRERMPTLSGLKGELTASENATTITLDASRVELDYPKLFRQPLTVTALRGDVRVERSAPGRVTVSTRDLTLETPHLQSRLWLDLSLGGEAPSIDAYAVYENGDISAASRYLPAGVMHDKTVAWFDDAFIAGHLIRGDLELRGPLKGFPYRNGEGLFRIDLDGRDAVINYANGWPVASGIRGHFNMNGPSLSVAVHEARIFDSRITNVDFHIADTRETLIELRGQHHGPTMDVVRYVRESPLREKLAVLADQLTVSGMQASDMYLRIPVKKRENLTAGYAFSTAVHDATFEFSDWGLRLEGVNSRFDYSDSATRADPFEARLNGHPVAVRLDSEADGDVTWMTVGVRGEADPDRLLQKSFPRGLQYIAGVTAFTAEVRLALRNPNGRDIPPGLHIESNLQGIEVGLPPPFTKTPTQPGRLRLDAYFQTNHEVTADFDYGDWLRGKFVLASEDGKLSLNRARLLANVVASPAQAHTPEEMPGITVQGGIPVLNVDDWQQLKWQGGGEGPGLIDKLLQADLEVGRFTYLNRTVENADIRATQELHNWKFELQSALARGSVLVPKDGFERRGLAIDVEYLDVDRLNTGVAGGEPPSPTRIPPFQLSADHIVLNEWRLKNLNVLAAPVDGGIKAHSIRIEDPSIGMQGEGVWTVDDNARHHTGLSVRFDSDNVGRGLENFGYSKVIRDGNGSAEFDVQWAGSPAEFSLGLLTGSAYLSLKDGQILDIDPKGGRLLGLLSVQTIPRRLALDFKDVFAKGFRFDKMKGHFTFDDGNAYTEDYYIDGPPGRIDIKGRTGLLARDYDQRVSFRPDLSSSLPLVGTLLGGTSAGVAMIVVDRIARVFGKQTDDLARFEYTLTGSWDDPVFTPVVKRTAKRELSERSD